MTTNKPEVKIYEPSEKGATIMRKASFRNTGPDRYVRLSDYEALQTECEKLRKDAERYQSLLKAVLYEIPHREWRRGNAPCHVHTVPGIWDGDNGELAGKECAWCKVWNEAVSAMQEANHENQ